jgi:hypothetical protein
MTEILSVEFNIADQLKETSMVKIPIQLKPADQLKETTVAKIPIQLKPKNQLKKTSPATIPFQLKLPKTLCTKIWTQHFPMIFAPDEATYFYDRIKNETHWESGIKSKMSGKPTRLAKSVTFSEGSLVQEIIIEAFKRMKLSQYLIYGIYINYYRDGNDYTPNHSHPGTTQLIISLNEPEGDRTLKVGKKDYHLNNGDCITFGSSLHGIAKEPHKKGRISIALFMKFQPDLPADLAYVEY